MKNEIKEEIISLKKEIKAKKEEIYKAEKELVYKIMEVAKKTGQKVYAHPTTSNCCFIDYYLDGDPNFDLEDLDPSLCVYSYLESSDDGNMAFMTDLVKEVSEKALFPSFDTSESKRW